jgi:hypothetical protein
VERVVLYRYWALYCSAIVLTLIFGGVAVSSLIRRPIDGWDEYIGVTLAVGFCLGIGFGYGSARSMVILFVPRAISIRESTVVGDFRRERWHGPPLREIRYEDIRAVRRSMFLRIPVVEGSPGRGTAKRLTGLQRFYVTGPNLLKVEEAVRRYRGAR